MQAPHVRAAQQPGRQGFPGSFDFDAHPFALRIYLNGRLKNRDPAHPYRHGRSTALEMPIRGPATILTGAVRAKSANGALSSAAPL